jgi:two-component system, OmpR family, sensor kinase
MTAPGAAAGAARGRIRAPFPRTLRGRLIAGLMALLALGCATVGLVTYFAVQGALSGELNRQLQTATNLAYNCWEEQFHALDNGTGGVGVPGGQSDNAAGDDGGDGQVSPGDGDGASPKASTGHSPSASPSPVSITMSCPGLGEGTFVAVVWRGQWNEALIGDTSFQLSSAEKRSLRAITPARVAAPGSDVPTTTQYLSSPQSSFLLTTLLDPDGDGSVYYTGLPLSTMHDQLRDVALAELIVFAGVLVLAGVLGTLWVRFSLRPLRRVAATASRVAELPLDSGDVSLPAGVPDTDPDTETGQLGLAFNRMLGHVQNALQRRAASEVRLRRFAADASHELRTPLAAIRGYAELGLLHPGDSPESVTHALRRVLSESTRMSVLVDDLLLLARLDAGRPLDSGPVDMARLAIDAASDAQAARRTHRWVLDLPDEEVMVNGDEHRLHQVLTNLLSNAGKHTPEGSTVTVAVSDRLPDGEPGTGPHFVRRGTIPPEPRVVVTVTDNGPGIPADLLPDLFERFTRADSARSHATNATSTGLGLAIVDAVVAAHHGAVLVTSRPGLTRFTLVLARLTESAPHAPQHEPRSRATAEPVNRP